jgi:type II secretory pathway component PulC
MSLTPRYENWLFHHAAWLGVWLVVIEGILLFRGYLAIPITPARPGNNSSSLAWREAGAPLFCDWSVFQKCDTVAGAGAGSLTLKRFRLAGTFFVYEEGTQETRKAVLDDLKDRTQRIVSESEDLGGIIVARILRDSVTLRTGDGQEEELVLGFSSGAPGTAGGQGAQSGANGGAPGDRFGARQVGERSWIVSRKSLLDYYQELRDEPQRLVNVFDSLKPLYDDRRRITGYKLGVEGEADFFAATGLKEGDVVRKVNSAPMTNRRQAERFIADFVNNRASAFVLEVERDGVNQKMVYQTR